MRLIGLTLIMIFAYSCSSVSYVRGSKVRKAIIEPGYKYRSIELGEIKTSKRYDTLAQDIRDTSSEFKSTLEREILKSQLLNVLEPVKLKKVIKNKLSNKQTLNSQADLIVSGFYNEIISHPIVEGNLNLNNKDTITAYAKFSFKVIDAKTNKILHADTFTLNDSATQQYGAGAIVSTTTDSNITHKIQEKIAKKFVTIFHDVEYSTHFYFKKGENNKYSKVLKYVENGQLDRALKEQDKYIKDGHEAFYNKAIIYVIMGDEKKTMKEYGKLKLDWRDLFTNDKERIRQYINTI